MRFWLLGLFFFLGSMHRLDAAETWAQKLGYGAQDRVVILYAEHMGAAYETNRAGATLFKQGAIQSSSVMVPCSWFDGFAEWRREHRDYDVGVSLTLNSPSKSYRWRPLTGVDGGSSLTDRDGYFWATPTQSAVRVRVEEVERELLLQIEHARAAGIEPSHLIPAMGTLFARPDLMDLYLNLAEKYWMPAVVVELTPDHIKRFEQEGFDFTEEMQALLNRYPLPKLDDIRFIPDTDSYKAKQDALRKIMSELEPGITQIMFGPAEQSKALKAITPRWQQLVWDARLLSDPKTRELLQKERVKLTDWREIMRRFDTGAREPGGRGT